MRRFGAAPPCRRRDFAERVWGRAPLLTRASELDSGFADLLDADAVDELVSRRGLRTPFLRMAKDGTVLAGKQFTRGGGAGAGIADQAADDRVLANLADGATLVLQGLHRVWPPLVAFGSQLADELGHPSRSTPTSPRPTIAVSRRTTTCTTCSCCRCPGASAGACTSRSCPIRSTTRTGRSRAPRWRRAPRSEPVLDTVLEPGDALYLPRGTIHAAEALGETSIHLTLGIHPLTRYTLVQRLLELAQHDPALRASLPMGVDLDDPAVLASHLDATINALRDFLDGVGADDVARGIGDRLRQQTRPQPVGPLAQLAAADALTGGTPLRLRPALRARAGSDEEHVTIELLDRTVTLPAAAADAVKTVLSGVLFTAAELPGLDADDQLVVARRLLREGVIVTE